MRQDMHITGRDTPVVTRFFWPPLTPRRMALPMMVSAQMSSPNTSIMACKHAKIMGLFDQTFCTSYFEPIRVKSQVSSTCGDAQPDA